MKLRTLKTLYLNYENNMYYEHKPTNNWNNIHKLKAGQDYDIIRIGLIGKVYQENDHIELVGKGWTIKFNHMQELMELVGNWFQIAG
ncbi:hypothetical protein [uncultured Clostridium sp.]|uniref:hypothetical protein n=1 Tax=uncultured Clostridium sp. TaxID=59620 RepID=UPI00261DB2E7|nr:hypothetical protein [uncultured Clostridium sp.]